MNTTNRVEPKNTTRSVNDDSSGIFVAKDEHERLIVLGSLARLNLIFSLVYQIMSKLR